MNKERFQMFYAIGLDFAVSGNGPLEYNANTEELACDFENAHEYAFYFARQACIDIRSRNKKDWSKMNIVRWFVFYRLPSLVANVFKAVFPKKATK